MMTNSISFRSQNTTLSTNVANTQGTASSQAAFDLIEWLENLSAVRTLTDLYSGLLEETITPRFTLHLLNVQTAAFFTLMPIGVDLTIRVLSLLWFGTSLCLARRAYSKM